MTKLPPDPDKLNRARADWAVAALHSFMHETGSDADTAVGDLLGDLMHACDRWPKKFGSFEEALHNARCHYLAETGQPGPYSD